MLGIASTGGGMFQLVKYQKRYPKIGHLEENVFLQIQVDIVHSTLS